MSDNKTNLKLPKLEIRNRTVQADLFNSSGSDTVLSVEGNIGDMCQEGGGSSNGVSWTASLFNLTNTCIGAGTLALPYVLHQCGLVLGVALISLIGCLSWFGLYFLTVSKILTKKRTFIEIAEAADGDRGKRIASMALFLMLLGPLSAYFSIIGSYLRTTAEDIFGEQQLQQWYLSKTFIMAFIGIVVMFPLSFKSLKFISYLAILALVSMLYAISLIPITYFIDLSNPQWIAPSVRLWVNTEAPWSILAAFSTIGMAFINHSIVVEATSDLENPTHYRQHTLTYFSSILTTMLYIITSVTGYLHFGYAVKGNILESYSQVDGQSGVEIIFARVLVAVCIALTYPAFIYPARSCLSGIMAQSQQKQRSSVSSNGQLLSDDSQLGDQVALLGVASQSSVFDTNNRKWYQKPSAIRVFQTVFIFGLSFGIAVAIPDLDKIFAFFGSLTGSLVVYILPVYFFVQIAQPYSLVVVEYLRVRIPWSSSVLFSVPRIFVLSQLHYDHGSPIAVTPTAELDGYHDLFAIRRVSIPIPNRERWTVHQRFVEMAIYANFTVGVLLLIFGTGFSIYDLFA
ncbi:hypothetical protein MP228_002085 [Amoeboaphelidium protococcarum]|nr:hypothetical protein MP228_002085 [Amoeboaphelidium protococcarum]